MRNLIEGALQAIRRADNKIGASKARRVTEVFAPGDASFGELAARATVDGIPVGISLAMIRGVAAGNYEVLILAPFLIPASLMMAIGVHYHINEARENSRKIQGK